MEADKWSTLPDDLLVDIFRRLETAAVIGCAGACRPWHRTIIDNASCLRPRPDRFLPDVLLGFFDKHSGFSTQLQQYVPATNTEVPSLFTSATGVGVGVSVDGRLYNKLLSSRDGLLLLGENRFQESLCLCKVVTGACKVVPNATLFDSCNSQRCRYVLATGYDVDDDSASDGSDEAAVWILAVKRVGDSKDGLIYQIFSTTSGAWGPVKCSAKFPEDVAHAITDATSLRGGVVVFHGAVCWFVYLIPIPNVGVPKRIMRTCMFCVDLRTARTWTTEIPDPLTSSPILAVSEDGQLSLAQILPDSHQIEVWVLDGDDQWTQRRTIDDVQKLLPNCPSVRQMSLSGFCPRSGFLFGTGTDDQNRRHHFVIGVDGSSPSMVGGLKSSSYATRFPYEMDWSVYILSYISKMNYF